MPERKKERKRGGKRKDASHKNALMHFQERSISIFASLNLFSSSFGLFFSPMLTIHFCYGLAPVAGLSE